MSLKIDASMSGVAHHIVNGPMTFPYAIDARHAVANHPGEWSFTPWSAEAAAAARRELGHPEIEISAEEQALIDEHAKAVAAAQDRLDAYRAKKAEEQAEADQIARDEALVSSAPPQPDPNKPKRPFGRAGDPTPAELEQIKKREAKKADDERMAREKADADAQANPNAKLTQ